MVHRSVIGSAERAVAHLIDVHGGAFPPWLAPVQLVALPVSDDQLPLPAAVVRQAIEQGLRAELARDGTLGARIRNSKLVPYLAVIGPAEAGVERGLHPAAGRSEVAVDVCWGCTSEDQLSGFQAQP